MVFPAGFPSPKSFGTSEKPWLNPWFIWFNTSSSSSSWFFCSNQIAMTSAAQLLVKMPCVQQCQRNLVVTCMNMSDKTTWMGWRGKMGAAWVWSPKAKHSLMGQMDRFHLAKHRQGARLEYGELWWTQANLTSVVSCSLLNGQRALMTSALCQVTFIFLCIWICSCKIFRKPCHGYSHNRVPRSKAWQVGSNKTSSNGNPLPVSQHILFAHRSPTSSRQNKRRTGWHTKTGTQQPPKSQPFYFQLKLSFNLSP